MKNILFLACVLFSLNVASQDSLMNKFNEINNQLYHKKPINYLKGLDILKHNEPVFVGSQLESFYYQIEAGFYTRIGKPQKAKAYYFKQDDQQKKVNLERQNVNNEIKKQILNKSKSTRVVMINENHVFPEHRVFTTSLLEGLYNNGFRYLALEDLSAKHVAELNSRNYPKVKDGFYINEIMYANMVRRARAIGFKMVAYDDNMAWDIAKRDSIGASELNKVFIKDPKAKVLVHCGFGHIDKTAKVLAYFISENIGIDPLIINQVNYTNDIQRAIYKPVGITPITKDAGDNYQFPADIQVLHPNYTSIDNRPDYLFKNGRIKKVIDLSNIIRKGAAIIEIRVLGEDELSMPLDRILIDESTKKISVSSLPKGTEAVIRDKNGKVIKRFNI